MDSNVVEIIKEFLMLIIIFDLFLMYSIIRGRQATINIIVALYLGLLLTTQLPYQEALKNSDYVNLAVFLGFSLASLFVIGRIMPDEFKEKKLESIPKKLLLSLGATILVFIYSYHVLHLNQLVDLGTPVDQIFGPEPLFFWWLLVPLIILFIT